MHSYSNFLKYVLVWSKLTSMSFSDTAFPFLFYLTYFSFFLLLLSADTQSRLVFQLFLPISWIQSSHTGKPFTASSSSITFTSCFSSSGSHSIFPVWFIFVFYRIVLRSSAKGAILPHLPHPFLMQFSITGKVSGCSWPVSAGMPVTKL